MSGSSLCDLLDDRAARAPERIGYRFLRDQGEYATLAYGELRDRALGIAEQIAADCAIGDRALVMLDTGPEFVVALFGCLYAGVIAVPTLASLTSREATERGAGIAVNCRPRCLITDRTHAPLAQAISEQAALADLIRLDPAAAPRRGVDRGRRGELAVLQYTSGSTANPKGVRLTHANLLHNCTAIGMAFGLTSESIGVGWLPLCHDMGLVGNVLTPLVCTMPVALMAPSVMLRRPSVWLRAISDLRATGSGGPNFAYDTCVDRITPEEAEGLDLSSWQVAYVGSEPVSAQTLRRFTDRFSRYGFRPTSFLPCYGLAEATLFVAGRGAAAEPAVLRVDRRALEAGRIANAVPSAREARLVGHRAPPAEARIEIAVRHREDDRPIAEGEIGEICIRSASVGGGYWGEEGTVTAEGFLRTGDLGFESGGELFITGRTKDLMIIRGRNVHPQDIEEALRRLDPVLASGSAAFSVPVARGEGLVIVQGLRQRDLKTVERDVLIAAMQRALSQQFSLKAHAIVFIPAGQIARTTSGKVRRQAMREAYLAEALAADSQPRERVPTRSPSPPTPKAPGAVDALLQRIQDYATRRLDFRTMDERRTLSPHVVLDFGRMGLLGLEAPPAWNGLGVSTADALRITERIAAIDLSLAAFVGVQNALGVGPLLRHGTLRQKRIWLKEAAAGRLLVSFALTEEGAGSNPRALRATARRTADGDWRLDGEKIWIGNAAWAGLLVVFARAEEVDGRALGITAFLVPTELDGVRNAEEAPTMGMRSMVQNRVCFVDVRVPATHVLGAVGQGMTVAQDTMSRGRLGIAAMSLGGIRRAVQIMTAYASTRTVATGRLLDHPIAAERVFNSACAARALDALLAGVAADADAGEPVSEEILALCKLTSTELLGETADQLLQMTGGRGYIESSGIPQLFRDARLLRIFEGPSETLAWFVGSRLLQESEPFCQTLAMRLQGPAGAERLATTLRDLRRSVDAAPLDGRLRTWSAFQAGQIAGWCTLASALEGKPAEAAADGLDALAWARARTQDCLDRIHRGAGETAWRCPADVLIAEAARYDARIGPAAAPPQRIEIESLLARTLTSPTTPVEQVAATASLPAPAAAAAATTPAATATTSAHAIEAKLVALVARRARVPEARVDRHAAFSEFGLDSVDAVELADVLSEWLGTSLDANVFLEHPSVAALTQHLLGERTPAASPPALLHHA
jgi:alkylation response protein AidB-like acyl-CoA dehydrogenase/acyl-CoA synthetase (AMP-forming)/AMP-acid ligase II/acyl carrier protein